MYGISLAYLRIVLKSGLVTSNEVTKIKSTFKGEEYTSPECIWTATVCEKYSTDPKPVKAVCNKPSKYGLYEFVKMGYESNLIKGVEMKERSK